jgi:hypothetical protein
MVGALVGMAWDGAGMMGLDAGLAFSDARVYGLAGFGGCHCLTI